MLPAAKAVHFRVGRVQSRSADSVSFRVRAELLRCADRPVVALGLDEVELPEVCARLLPLVDGAVVIIRIVEPLEVSRCFVATADI